MTPASTSQRQSPPPWKPSCVPTNLQIPAVKKQGTGSHRCIILTFARIMALVHLLLACRCLQFGFRSVHATRDTGILFSEFLRPNSDEHLPRWPAKVVKQVVKVSPVCTGQKETFNQVTESRPVPHKNPLVVLLSTSVCRPSSHEITLQLSTFTFTFACAGPEIQADDAIKLMELPINQRQIGIL